MDRLVECVPNVSEGQDKAVLALLTERIQSVPNVDLLDLHMDPDHHRSVFTLAGEPEAMATALFQFIQEAQHRIDLRRHQGQHPRIGAVDVVPWIPLRGVTVEECAKYAKDLGRRVGQELGIPVFLYEQAALVPLRARLEIIRRGGLSGLQERMDQEEDWKPDFGPKVLHPTAGAVAIGARFFLIAFNVVLKSQDIQVARRIAGTIRSSDGGLPALKAMGVPLSSKGLVQVSMNLMDFRETSLRAAFQAVERESHRLGVKIQESEIVGLVPQEAWDGDLAADLKLKNWNPEGVLEVACGKYHLFPL
ncbi:glutamate formimidoyltransferase [Nitrospira sp. T9]|uniref:glutamate formimidoyltransferase n=1 Tax=unclassified Nitrospira TaxID=2652172 RepID=UPI003F99F39A